ncbi:MAG: GDSL-type esterase/lipase family protein [Pirellulales bacterium]
MKSIRAASVVIVLGFLVTESPLAIAQGQTVGEKQASSGRDLPESDQGLAGAGPVRRADWFRTLWRNRRNAFAERTDRDGEAVVFFGDSITEGWGDDFRGDFGQLKVANRGIGGDTTRGMLFRLEGDVLAVRPRGVVLLAGTNDLELGAAPQTIADNVKLILERLKTHDAKMPIVLCQVMPSSGSQQRPADKVRELNRLLAEAAKGNEQVTVLDTYTLFANPQGDAKREEFPDLLHPNRAGYAKWKAGLWPLLATLGFVETTPDNFAPEAGFESLFNGRDLTGWGILPSTPDDIRIKGENADLLWPIVTTASILDGKTQSDEGRYVAKNGRLIVTTPTEGRRVQKLSTTREFPSDFVLKLEFRATPNADSGVFLRGRQLQCRDYALAGPYMKLTKYKPQDWNELVVTVKGNKAHCTCNGEVLEEAFEIPATGPVGLEGDRGQIEYRRILISGGR